MKKPPAIKETTLVMFAENLYKANSNMLGYWIQNCTKGQYDPAQATTIIREGDVAGGVEILTRELPKYGIEIL